MVLLEKLQILDIFLKIPYVFISLITAILEFSTAAVE